MLIKSLERCRLALEKCDFNADLQQFITSSGTGNRPTRIHYIKTAPNGFIPYVSGNIANDRGSIQSSIDLNIEHLHLGSRQKQENGYLEESRYVEEPRYDGASKRQDYESLNYNASSKYVENPNYGKARQPNSDANAQTDQVRVLYDYASQAPEELTIKSGDMLTVTARHEDGYLSNLIIDGGRESG
jgi:hypothetical protein